MPLSTTVPIMYNDSVKIKYLQKYKNADTKEVYGRIFKKSLPLEMQYEKDLCNFSEGELRTFVMQILQPKTKESTRSIYSTISSYIEWSIKEGHSKHAVNPWKKRGQSYIYDLVVNVKNYMSFNEKQFIIDKLVNYQDKFIIEALWNGIQGDKLSELTTLTMKHVNEKRNAITIYNELADVQREIIAFDDTLCEYALLANDQKHYFKKNGECSENTISESAELVDSDYIIKQSNTKHRGNKVCITHYTIYNRIEMLRDLRHMEPFSNVLVTKNIVRSGMIYYALQLYKRDGALGKEQLEEVCNRYNIRFKWSIKDFLNVEQLQQLYPEQMSVQEQIM